MGTRPTATLANLRPEIAASWARSSLSGVADDRIQAPPAPWADPEGRLAHLAAPVLGRLAATLAETRTTVVLTDAQAAILDRRAGVGRLHDLLDDLGLVPGFSYAEDVVGTNGMGTAAAQRRPVIVAGEEHYTEALRGLTCVGAPIEHPLTGRLEGILDLTCFNEDAGPWMTALVTEAVAGIRAQLEEHSTTAERALLAAFLRASYRASGAVVSLNDSFVLTNPAAARLLDGADHSLLWEAGAEAVGTRHAPELELHLAGGSVVRATFEVVEVGDRPVGAVVRLTEAEAQPARNTRSAGPSRSITARLADEVALALQSGGRPLVRGPSGAGKLAVVQLALGAEDAAIHDAGRALVDGAGAWLADVEQAIRSGRTVVIRHLDVLAPDAAAGLAAVVDGAPIEARLVGTAGEDAGPTADAAQALADRFDPVVRVPALADRTEELPALVRSILRRLVPTGAVQCSPEVLQALGRVDLPGNLRQLASVLHRVATRRRTGTITLDDLPPEVRAAAHRHHLTPFEQHECQAITRALAEADGNKAKAAAALGISRSTLYRKLESYGLQLDRRAW